MTKDNQKQNKNMNELIRLLIKLLSRIDKRTPLQRLKDDLNNRPGI